MKKKYDVAAYIWPAYTGNEPRAHIFWPEKIGEWQTVKNSARKTADYFWNRKPLWGYVNEADPKEMERQITEATSHGINIFIYDWYWYDKRPYLENCLNDGFLKARNRNDMRFYLMWANHNANQYWDIRLSDDPETVIWDGKVAKDQFDIITDRIINRYFSQDNYYKIDGKPVFMIYDINNLIVGLGGIAETRAALDEFRKKTLAAGFPGLELQMTVWSENMLNLSGFDSSRSGSTKEFVRLLGFDSISHYQFVHFCNMNRDYTEILCDVKAEWERIDREYTVPYYPHVSVGWDNNPRFRNFQDYACKNNTPENFEAALRMAKDYLDRHPKRHPLVTINSWNEWTETSYLEPDDLYGYGYLEAVKKVFG